VKNVKNISKDPRARAQELKDHYKSHFVQNSDKFFLKIFYNYYCQLGHISVECKLRKRNNKIKIVWVPKSKE
jgi:hypothetical protein